MYDLFETAYGPTYEAEYDGDFEYEIDGPFSAEAEMALAAELLTVSSDEELEQFLGKLFKKVKRGLKKVARPLGRILKPIAKKVLPIAAGALGSVFGGPAGGMIGSSLGSLAGRAFGLELEGMSPEDQEFEVARRFVRFAGEAARTAGRMQDQGPNGEVAKRAVKAAARIHAPGLLKPRIARAFAPSRSRSGRWVRRGRKIIVIGA
ncbi:MAG: hypothetical protein AAGI08_11755 [Bacteroidota bacterium]